MNKEKWLTLPAAENEIDNLRENKQLFSFKSEEEKLNFTVTLVPYVTDTSWVQDNINDMKKTLELEKVPEINKSCEKCMYLNAGKEFI